MIKYIIKNAIVGILICAACFGLYYLIANTPDVPTPNNQWEQENDSLSKENAELLDKIDSLVVSINKIDSSLIVVSKKREELVKTADSSLVVYLNDSSKVNAIIALDDCTEARDTLESENSILTDKNTLQDEEIKSYLSVRDNDCKIIISLKQELWGTQSDLEKERSKRWSFTVHAGIGPNSDILLNNIRIGYSVTAGVSYKIFVK